MNMKLLPPFLLFFFIVLTDAQRRTTISKSTTEASITKPTSSRSRGRSRFVASEEFQGIQRIQADTSSTSESTTRKTIASRRRVVENVEQRIPATSYISNQPLTVTTSTPKRLLPTFNDTAERIFTVTENTNKRFQQKSTTTTFSSENAKRKISKPLTEYVEKRNFKNAYEVQEMLDEDFELVRRSQKPRVFTENSLKTTNILNRNKDNFQINQFPKRKQENTELPTNNSPRRNKEITELSKSLNIPSRGQENIALISEKSSTNILTPEFESNVNLNNLKDTNLIAEQSLDTTQVPTNLETISDQVTNIPSKEDTPVVQISSTTTTTTSKVTEFPIKQENRRKNIRKITAGVAEPSTQSPRSRSRSRKNQTSQVVSTSVSNLKTATSTSSPGRGFRRRQETTEPRKRLSVLPADSQFQETKSRNGRKINSSAAEKIITVESSARNRYRTTTPKFSKTTSIPTFTSRNGFRLREMPIIDEQKLEVLPLFEVEPKLVVTNQADFLPRTEKSIVINEKPSLTKSDSIDSRLKRKGGLQPIQITASEMKNILTKPLAPSLRSRVPATRNSASDHKTEVKESVVSEINEVTSRRKVSRKKIPNFSEIKEKAPINSRGSKKSEVFRKVNSEEVEESDNYPEEFKALIKAKHEKKISDNENSLKSKAITSSYSSRLNRKRFTASSTVKTILEPTTEERFNTKTTSFSTTSSPSKRATKYRTLPPRSFSSLPKLEKGVSFKPIGSDIEKPNEGRGKRFGRGKSAKKTDDPVFLSTKVPKYLTTSKKLDRSKYRSEYSNRGSTTVPPKYIPTIPSVPYVPTVPTITPPRTLVGMTSNQKDYEDDAVISIDVPVKALISANLVNDDLVLSTTKSVPIPLPLVADGTTEKATSIIERIINSISSRSTTLSPSNKLSSSTESTTEFSSAILKLSPKKSRQTDGTDVTKATDQTGTVTLTTENPTTIIERILSSLNAIQATDITSLAQVGTEFVKSRSIITTPLSVIKSSTASSLLAPSSTTNPPPSNLDDISSKEIVQKQAINKLLDILNSMLSSQEPNEFVIVTPKTVNKQTGRGPFVSTTFFPTFISEFTTANTVSTLPSFGTESISPNLLFSEQSDVSSSEFTSVAPSTSDVPLTTTISPESISEISLSTSSEEISGFSTDITTRFTETDKTTTVSTENSSTVNMEQLTSTTEISTTESSTSSSNTIGSTVSENINLITLLSSLPSLEKFEVSPGSVSIVSANDIYSNLVTPEDNISTTTVVNIAGSFSTENSTTIQSTTTDGDSTTTIETTSEMISTPSVETTSVPMPSSTSVNNTQTNNTRKGKLLDFVQEQPLQNAIDASTPDYFIFAVLNNNTVLRKRPHIQPKSSYYVIGVYPNNTVVKKYPNGTDVPMEMPIRVRGFDTRENPPPLPDITSNQVTSDPGSSMDNKNVQTEEQNTIPTVDVASPSVTSSTSTKPTKAQNTQPFSTSPTTTTTTTMATTTIESAPTKIPDTTTTISMSTTVPTIQTQSTTATVPTTTTQPPSTTSSPTTSSNIDSTTSLEVNSLTPESLEGTTLKSTNLTSTENSSTVTQGTSEISTIVSDTVTVETSTLFTVTTTTARNNNNPTFPTISELFNGKTIEAFNEIVINSDDASANNIKNESARMSKVDTTTPLSQDSTTENVSTTNLQTSTIAPTGKTISTVKPVETTTLDNTEFISNQILEEFAIVERLSPVSVIQRIRVSTVPTTTGAPTTSTQPEWIFTSPPSIIPTFLTTLFPNLFNTETTKGAKPTTKTPDIIRISAAPSVSETASFTASTTTDNPTRTTLPINPTVTTTTTLITTKRPTTITVPTTTTRPPITEILTTTTQPTTTEKLTTTVAPTTTTTTTTTSATNTETTRLDTFNGDVQTNKAFTTARTFDITDYNTIEFTTKSIQLNGLTTQQKQNLKAIAELEKEQAELLNQLSFLTRLVPNRNTKSTTNENRNAKSNSGASLAERIVALAVERDRAKTTTMTDTTITSTTDSSIATTRAPQNIQDQIAALYTTKQPKKVSPGLEEVLKGYNLNSILSPTSSTYGKSEDAILASLLKEQGIVPSTPKVLAGIFDETTVRPKPRPRVTTPAPGPIMRGLNWLLNTLAPSPAPVTRKPTSKPLKPKKPPVEEELLVNSPTHMTPVSTAAPSKLANSLSQDDIKKLIKQLEGIQKNPSTGTLDLSQLKSIQNLINVDEGVVISANGEHGTTSRRTTTLPTTIISEPTQRQPKKLPTLPTENQVLAVSNEDNSVETVESTTRVLKAPIGFNPVPGIDDSNPDAPNSLVRSNLITAAVNVTKAISNFLGTVLQGAASSFQTLFGVSSVGTRVLSSAAGGSSAG